MAVDAVVYFRISDPTMSVTNVEKVDQSTRLLAQTTLRNFLGTKNLSEILADREEISHTMQVCLMPNSPLFFLNNLCLGTCFFAGVKVNHRRVYFHILAKVYAVAMAMGLAKNKA